MNKTPPSTLIVFNKPCGVLCQFTGEATDKTLADFIPWPGFYPAGRLDKMSEGLLLLTSDGRLQDRLCHPRHGKEKRYWAQVEGIANDSALEPLLKGLRLGDTHFLPAKAECMEAPALWERTPPIRVRKSVPDSWVCITLNEGKNHQVRRMLAAVGLPVLRLVRVEAAGIGLQGLQPGEYRFQMNVSGR
ncbi:pseudouridine synthase [Legionella geestiana]|uniref:Pseudouridine synthase n=1 Tax=Legionella geestiana TaxID=45065 RepID=A0A0W0TSW3_9GAMM|nr:pseudouridine synthase [Legionella geestiana]KTC98501.1 pseudouridine synthase [Legionella geestiana]QBS13095.1 pseudouridine synthase [Legionella geestiana]QDQ39226.1 pseudouridine synthase [Legionella geestiana]STX54390.1 pseudouridine synthase [Legionella geestiana]